MGEHGGPVSGVPTNLEKEAQALAAETAAAVYRAHRAVRFYPDRHPSALQALEVLGRVLTKATAKMGTLRLDVRDHDLGFGSQGSFRGDDPRDDLAHAMYLDGIRSVEFAPGVQLDEARAFIDAVIRAEGADRADHDLATILWELDLPHITFTIADPLLDEHSWEGKGNMVDGLRADLAESVVRSPLADLGVPVAPTVGAHATAEYRRLMAEAPATEREVSELVGGAAEPTDILAQFLEILIELLSLSSEDRRIASVAHAISDVLQSHLEWGDYSVLTRAVESMREICEDTPDKTEIVSDILAAVVTSEALRSAVLKLEGSGADSRAALEELLYELRDLAYPTIVALLAEAEGQLTRKCLLDVCQRGTGVPIELIVPRLADERWYVVRNMVFLLGSLGCPEIVPHLERTADHPDERVRRETVRALSAVRGDRVADMLKKRLHDPAASVRTVAARNLPGAAGPAAVATLLDHIESREFQHRGEGEIEAFFDALAEVAADTDVPRLVRLWSGHSLLRNRPTAMRLGALRAVARIDSPVAEEALSRAAASTDGVVARGARSLLTERQAKRADTGAAS